MLTENKHQIAIKLAKTIITGFDRHFRIFNEFNAGAKQRFEDAAWEAVQQASKERIQSYDKRINETIKKLKQEDDIETLDEPLWKLAKKKYVQLLKSHSQPELAESYYNSVFCNMYHRHYYHNDNIFVKSSIDLEEIKVVAPILRSFNLANHRLSEVIKKIILSFDFSLSFQDLDRDIRLVIKRFFQESRFDLGKIRDYRIDVIRSLFFRNKAAYIIGRVVSTYGDQPFIIPVLNNQKDGLYLDTLITNHERIAIIFGFSRAYFMVDTDSPAALISYLQHLLTHKSRTELYTYIGFQKHGKTQFYREFLEHLENSSDNLVTAPGIKGMVMVVFTLASYPYVFKMIKDKFPAEKNTTPEKVKEKYLLVKLHDRVGRMADTLEYSDVALPKARFSADLLDELVEVAPSKIEFEGNDIILKHVYIERRMTPLNIYLQNNNKKLAKEAIIDYGNAIKQMIAANIFPGDMLLKNFGVTRHGRVVFYDYDEIEYLTDINFRKIPKPHTLEDEFSAEPWYHVGPYDVFPEQFGKFVLTNKLYRDSFMEKHANLLDAEYWQRKQRKIGEGHFDSVFPYPQDIRFHQCDN